jgi:hypothetical protein
MTCCLEFDQSLEDGLIIYSPAHELADGPIMNQIISEYYFRAPRAGAGYSYYAINYCPYCGMPRSQVKQGFVE